MDGRTNPLASVAADDRKWCHETVGSVSRTFAISIELLEEPMSTTLCVGYLLCRIADTVEDESTLSAEEKSRLLSTYRRALDPADPSTTAAFARSIESVVSEPDGDDWYLVANAERVVRTYESFPPGARDAITPPVLELVAGMGAFVKRHADEAGVRIQTEAELEEYCYYVAGVIGRLITNLQLWNGDVDGRPERMRELSESCGQLLQLVNIAKDVHADYVDEGNVYLPASWLADVGVSQENLLADGNESDVVAVVERTVERARGYVDDGQRWLEALGANDESMLKACTVPFLLAVATLRELSERPEAVLTDGGVKISRTEVMTIVASVTTDFDRSSIGPLRESVRRGELT
ncbi:phytoene/squalene synthase family protein [Natrarchaeobius oligotrophus]|uniref:Squalene/phytoene synthase family protein n=1 Tax=Natrarchaeobius chitinivorans TaxID=1679083 RepID=A0A3N6PNE5_NATCH|nr:phytoene/squalene synthase family protein [Natrarchaeobius chitinivorans]RQH03240.1 squalene/phytoene synthase family protein [Natrarchaeobius chitinivorans]